MVGGDKMKKEKILELACIIVNGILTNPVNAPLCDQYNAYQRGNLIQNEVQQLLTVAQGMGIQIEEEVVP